MEPPARGCGRLRWRTVESPKERSGHLPFVALAVKGAFAGTFPRPTPAPRWPCLPNARGESAKANKWMFGFLLWTRLGHCQAGPRRTPAPAPFTPERGRL